MVEQNLDLSVKGTTVQSIYNDYLYGKFNVNRKYQRKLVWKEREKAYLIDSILKNLPIPLVLLAKGATGGYEIVDGLQRINAIVEFLENQYPVNGKYFDLQRLGDTKDLADRKILIQKYPKLSAQECRRIYNYEVPVSVYSNNDEEDVEEVFRRINSSGQHLSRQDIRQAGAIGELPTLVRRIASEIRGDMSTNDIVPLDKMGEISLNDSEDRRKGLQIADIYWVANGILDEDSIRSSRDEELILDILLDILNDSPVPSDSKKRDEAYGLVGDRSDEYESKVRTRGSENIAEEFLQTFDTIRFVSEKAGKNWTTLTSPGTRARRKGRYYQLLFFPFYKFLVRENKVISNDEGLLEAMTNFWEKSKIEVPKGGGTLSLTEKARIFGAVKAQLEPYFTAGNPEAAARRNKIIRRFEGDLTLSLIETSRFEIKVGLTDLQNGGLNQNLIRKIPKIASAIANTHPATGGVIYIGVTDDDSVAEKIGRSISVKGFYCVGIDHDLDSLQIKNEKYLAVLRGEFKKHSSTDPRYADFAIDLFDYHGHSIVSIRTPKLGEPLPFVGDKFWYRDESHTIEVGSGREMFDFFKKFDDSAKEVARGGRSE